MKTARKQYKENNKKNKASKEKQNPYREK
jgi:hypothetical protein